MEIHFYKYQGTGNDFVIVDNRDGRYSTLTTAQIHFICDRRKGIGADGMMMLNSREGYDFEMKYYNADGKEGSMCGNGGRCLVQFAHDRGIHKDHYHFIAFDGDHEAEIDRSTGIVRLKMNDVNEVVKDRGDFILNTGSPHFIRMVHDVMSIDVFKQGRLIRYNEPFTKEGINVNFTENLGDDKIIVRTYERGVEDETLSCGTGVTAASLMNYHNEHGFNCVQVQTKGGQLSVEFDRIDEEHFTNIWLCGPALHVFEGDLILKAPIS